MKKILCLFGALALTITSCSSNDNDSAKEETAILPKTIKSSLPDYPASNKTSALIYDGNKIVSEINEKTKKVYTYEGNVIIKMVEYNVANGDKEMEESYSYTNGKLTSTFYAENFTSQYPFGQYRSKYVYTYNADGTVKKETYTIDPKTGEESTSYIEVYTMQNGNIVKMVTNSTKSASTPVRTSLYEYDTKNNPYKNVLGYNLLLDEDNFTANNLTKHSYTYSGDATLHSYKIVYEYNDKGYPTKETFYKQDGVTVDEIIEYTY